MKKNKLKNNEYASENTIDMIADFFNIFGDSTRCKIVATLFKTSMKVTELANKLGMTISAISHSLRILKQAKIVKATRTGREITYSLNDDHIFKIFEMAKEHVEE